MHIGSFIIKSYLPCDIWPWSTRLEHIGESDQKIYAIAYIH